MSPCLFCPFRSVLRSSERVREMYDQYHNHHHLRRPCLHCHPHSYIRMVQHLIERCLLLQMSREQCVKALAEHASILPLITLTVWKELQKENRDFFQQYLPSASYRTITSNYVHGAPRFTRRKQRKSNERT